MAGWLKRVDVSGEEESFVIRRMFREPNPSLVLGEKRTAAVGLNKRQRMHPSIYEGGSGRKRCSQRLHIAKYFSLKQPDSTGDSVGSWGDRKKRVPVGPQFQAVLPVFSGAAYETDSKWLGSQIWPLGTGEQMQNLIERDPIGNGRHELCDCQFPRSAECIRFHIREKRMKVKLELGSAFYKWKIDQMGEEVAFSWTKEDEAKFETIVKSNRLSSGKYFWDELFKFFPGKGREALVSYYFNVFLLRRRIHQNRSSTSSIHSNDDESEFGPIANRFGQKAANSPGDLVAASMSKSQQRITAMRKNPFLKFAISVPLGGRKKSELGDDHWERTVGNVLPPTSADGEGVPEITFKLGPNSQPHDPQAVAPENNKKKKSEGAFHVHGEKGGKIFKANPSKALRRKRPCSDGTVGDVIKETIGGRKNKKILAEKEGKSIYVADSDLCGGEEFSKLPQESSRVNPSEDILLAPLANQSSDEVSKKKRKEKVGAELVNAPRSGERSSKDSLAGLFEIPPSNDSSVDLEGKQGCTISGVSAEWKTEDGFFNADADIDSIIKEITDNVLIENERNRLEKMSFEELATEMQRCSILSFICHHLIYNRCKSSERRVTVQKQTIEKLELELKNVKEARQILDAKALHWKIMNEEVLKQGEKTTERIIALEKKEKLSTAIIDQLTRQLKISKANLDQKDKELEEAHQKIAQLTHKVDSQKKLLNGSISELEKKLTNLDQKYLVLKKRNNDLEIESRFLLDEKEKMIAALPNQLEDAAKEGAVAFCKSDQIRDLFDKPTKELGIRHYWRGVGQAQALYGLPLDIYDQVDVEKGPTFEPCYTTKLTLCGGTTNGLDFSRAVAELKKRLNSAIDTLFVTQEAYCASFSGNAALIRVYEQRRKHNLVTDGEVGESSDNTLSKGDGIPEDAP